MGGRDVNRLTMSDDGRRWACQYTRARDDGELGWRLEDTIYIRGLDEMELTLMRSPGPDATLDEQRAMYIRDGVAKVAFSPDASRWAMLYEAANGNWIYIDGKALDWPFPNVDESSCGLRPTETTCCSSR